MYIYIIINSVSRIAPVMPLPHAHQPVQLLLLLGCSLLVLIELTSSPEEGNSGSRAVPEVYRTEWLCVCGCLNGSGDCYFSIMWGIVCVIMSEWACVSSVRFQSYQLSIASKSLTKVTPRLILGLQSNNNLLEQI